jgi:hypothetical protein
MLLSVGIYLETHVLTLWTDQDNAEFFHFLPLNASLHVEGTPVPAMIIHIP